MHEYEQNILQQQIARLENTVSKRTVINFVWLMFLSNLLFWLFIAHVSLKKNMNAFEVNLSQNELKYNHSQPVEKPKTNL